MYVCSSPIYKYLCVCMIFVLYTTTFFSVVSFECLFHHHHTKLYICASPNNSRSFFLLCSSSKLSQGGVNVTFYNVRQRYTRETPRAPQGRKFCMTRDSLIHGIAGATGGTFSAILCAPLDTSRTRMQIDSSIAKRGLMVSLRST